MAFSLLSIGPLPRHIGVDTSALPRLQNCHSVKEFCITCGERLGYLFTRLLRESEIFFRAKSVKKGLASKRFRPEPPAAYCHRGAVARLYQILSNASICVIARRRWPPSRGRRRCPFRCAFSSAMVSTAVSRIARPQGKKTQCLRRLREVTRILMVAAKSSCALRRACHGGNEYKQCCHDCTRSCFAS